MVNDKIEGQQTIRIKELALIGKLEPYVTGESFDDYLLGVNNYFELNNLKNETFKIRLLVNQIGSASSLKIIKSFRPNDFSLVKYEEFVKKCKKLFRVERSAIVEHFTFNNRSQRQGESLSDFAFELQALAEHCEFNSFLDTALRDRFVAGIRKTLRTKELFSLPTDATFADVVECAKEKEDLVMILSQIV